MKTYPKVILGIILIVIVFGLAYMFDDKTPSIKVLSPVGGDSVVVGSVQKIKWSTKNIPGNYKVSVAIRRIPPPALKEEGQEFDPLVFTDLPNTGSADWTVSDMYPAGNYVLELTAYAGVPVTNPVSGESEIFSIKRSSGQEKKVTFACDAGKSIGANFYIGDDKFVDLVLSDGRTLSVPRAVSASGARYANTDETFVFWNKGDTAFITEGENSKTTFANCVLKNEPVIGGDRDVNGCLGPAGYSFNENVGACIRAFDMTDDIMKAAKLAVDSVGRGYALTVASFNSYEELGSYDIFLERGVERTKQTVYIKNWKVTGDASLSCSESSKYFVIEKSLAPNVGSNILVKYKTSPSQIISCKYVVASGDFELKNLEAQYFLAFTDNFMLVDKGTAPEPRGLIVYDLKTKKQVFSDSYAKPVLVDGDSITYLSKTNIKTTTQNCPDLKTYTENGLGAIIMSKVTVNLLTLYKKDLGQTQCRATQ